MKLISIAKAAAVAILGTMLTVSCEKPNNGPATPEDINTNFFIYDGYSFVINSAVQYDKGDNTLEFWLSPVSGLTTSEEIKAGGDYVVINTHKSYLGNRDRFNTPQSKDSYICFCEQKFAYGNVGTAYIEVQIANDNLTLNFLAEKLYTKADNKPSGLLSGEYKGTFVVEKEQPYNNDWGYDRKHTAIKKAVFTTREDGGDSTIALFEENGSEGIRIEFPNINVDENSAYTKEYHITASDYPQELKLYTKGRKYALKGAAGTIRTTVNNNEVIVNISLIKDGSQLCAVYSGAYERKTVKLNRFVYEYVSYDTKVETRNNIVELLVEESGDKLKIGFSPSDGYSFPSANYTHMPILTIPASIINTGKKNFNQLTGWEFLYDIMQVWPYENDEKPHPADTDWIYINHNDDVYEIEFVLTSQGTLSKPCSIDVYYKGEVK